MPILHLSILSGACAVVVNQSSFMEQPAQQNDSIRDFWQSEDDAYNRGFEQGVRQTAEHLSYEHDLQIQRLRQELNQWKGSTLVLVHEVNQIRDGLVKHAGVLREKHLWFELLVFWVGLPAGTMNFLLGSTDHFYKMLVNASDVCVQDMDVCSTFIDKISPENLGIHADGWNLLFVVTHFVQEFVPRHIQTDWINRILSKMLPGDILQNYMVNHDNPGTAFHRSMQQPLEIAKTFARHRHIPAGHFLVADGKDSLGNDIFFDFLSPVMRSVRTENLDMPLMILKAFIDKFCFKLKMLRMTCKFLSKALKRDEILPTNNNANVLFSLPKEVLTKIGKHVATLYVAHNRVGDDVLPDGSIHLGGAHGNMSVKQVLSRVRGERRDVGEHHILQGRLRCNLMNIFQMYKNHFLSRDAAKTKKLEEMLNNPMAFEELPFDY